MLTYPKYSRGVLISVHKEFVKGRDNDKHSNVLSLQPTRRNGSLYAKPVHTDLVALSIQYR